MSSISSHGQEIIVKKIDWHLFLDFNKIAEGQNYSSKIPEIIIDQNDEFENIFLKIYYSYNNDSLKPGYRNLYCRCMEKGNKNVGRITQTEPIHKALNISRRKFKKWMRKCKNEIVLLYQDPYPSNGFVFIIRRK